MKSLRRNSDRPLKFTFKEQKEFEQIDGIIAGLEAELSEVKINIGDAASGFERLQELLSRQDQLERRLEGAMERWVYLNELAEGILKSKNKS